MLKKVITQNSKETQKLGEEIASRIFNFKNKSSKNRKIQKEKAMVICLEGNLGAGKTTFTQGFLRRLKLKGPFTSPTFLIMKNYHIQENNNKNKFENVYHIDAYRIEEKDMAELGWEEIVSNSKNIVIIEWSERLKKIIPKESYWIRFKQTSKKEEEREIEFGKNFIF